MAVKTIEPKSLSSSVEWIDLPESTDKAFFEDVPTVPALTSQAIYEALISNKIDKLFKCEPPDPWATFFPFNGYFYHIKKLFRQKVLSSFETEVAIKALDDLHENGIPTDTLEGEKIYEMLYTLENLNDILETIYLKIFSTLKP